MNKKQPNEIQEMKLSAPARPVGAMLDLETLAVPEELPPGSLVEVTEIGLVLYDLATYETRLTLRAFLSPNGQASHGTLHWWFQRFANGHIPDWYRARDQKQTLSMDSCLENISKILQASAPHECWSRGAFDWQILQSHFAANRMHAPWRFYQLRELRTLHLEVDPKHKPPPAPHNALEDALEQVRLLARLKNQIKGISA